MGKGDCSRCIREFVGRVGGEFVCGAEWGYLYHAFGEFRALRDHPRFRTTMARHLGIPVVEQAMPRELLYIADEAFFTGTAAEVHPIRSVDRIPIGDGDG